MAVLRRIVRWGQWAAILVLPAWLFLGSVLFASGGGWYVFVLIVAVPVLAVLLVVGPLISLAVPRGDASPVTAVAAIENLVLWGVVVLIPFALEEAGDGPVGPSLFERLGLPSDADQTLIGLLGLAIPILLLATWATWIVAAVRSRRNR
jgi:hypothetical protein